MLKVGLKYFKRLLMALFTAIMVYLLAVLVLSIVSTNPKNFQCNKVNEIYLATNGIHLEIIIPAKALAERIGQEIQLTESVSYVSFGWGDKIFYLETPTWNDLKIRTAVKALFLRSEAAVHLTNYTRKYAHWHSLQICDEQLEVLIQYLDKSFKRDDLGKIIEIKDAGYTDFDTFYEATGNYNYIQTCNQWVNNGLKAAGIKTAVWSPFDQGVLYQISKNFKPCVTEEN